MSTSLKSSLSARVQAGPNNIFRLPEQRAEKNGFRRSPRIDDLASTLTWTTPQNSLFTGPACRAAGRRSHHHDA